MKRVTPIEKLLQWAYGIEQVHKAPIGGPASARAQSLTGAGGGGGGSSPSRVHNDALTIDRFVSGLRSADARTLVRRHGISGTRPDWGQGARHRIEPAMWVEDWYDEDAQTWKPNAYFRETLREGDPRRPDILVNAMRPSRVNDYWTYCPIKQVDAPHDVLRERMFYAQWVVGLEQLRDALLARAQSLVDHRVSDVLPPLEPWDERQPTIFGLSSRSLTTA